MSTIRRQRNGISSVDALQTLVSFSTDPHAPPCTMKPRVSGVSLDDLRDERLEQTRQLLAQHGCVLLRSFQVEGAAMFSSFMKRLACGGLISPDTSIGGKYIYRGTLHD